MHIEHHEHLGPGLRSLEIIFHLYNRMIQDSEFSCVDRIGTHLSI